jgi:6-phosphogluconolactonase (cycloisomerase 2 family)
MELDHLMISPFSIPAKGAGPRQVRFSPDEKRAFVINELDCTITVFDVDAHLTLVNPTTVSTLPPGTLRPFIHHVLIVDTLHHCTVTSMS